MGIRFALRNRLSFGMMPPSVTPFGSARFLSGTSEAQLYKGGLAGGKDHKHFIAIKLREVQMLHQIGVLCIAKGSGLWYSG